MSENIKKLFDRLDSDDDGIFRPEPLSSEEYRKLRSLEYDLMASEVIREKVLEEAYSFALYGALCNNNWYKPSTGQHWHGSWRHNGDVVAGLVSANGCYLDYYCTGNEGKVDPEIQKDLEELGWFVSREERIQEEREV